MILIEFDMSAEHISNVKDSFQSLRTVLNFYQRFENEGF